MQTLTKTHKILLGLLGLQIVLTIFVLVRGDDSTPTKEEPLLPGFDAAKVTRVKVFAAANPDAPAIDLAKRGTSWALASGFDFPADSTKVDALLTPIAKMAAAEPIATSAARHKQLKVGDKDFERKLVLTADGKDVTLYIGASAGLRRNAVRLGGGDAVYAVAGVTPFLAATEPRQWVKGSYVDVPRDEITKVTIARDGTTIDLVKDQPPAPPAAGSGSAAEPPVPPPATWKATIDGAAPTFAAGESLDPDAIDRVVNEVAAIAVDTPADPKRDASKPTATITITKKSGNPVVIDVIADGERFWIHDKTQAQAVLVPKTALTAAMELDRAKLTKKPPPPPAPEPGAGSGSAAKPPAPGAPAPKAPAPAPKAPAAAPKAPAPAPKAPAPAAPKAPAPTPKK